MKNYQTVIYQNQFLLNIRFYIQLVLFGIHFIVNELFVTIE